MRWAERVFVWMNGNWNTNHCARQRAVHNTVQLGFLPIERVRAYFFGKKLKMRSRNVHSCNRCSFHKSYDFLIAIFLSRMLTKAELKHKLCFDFASSAANWRELIKTNVHLFKRSYYSLTLYLTRAADDSFEEDLFENKTKKQQKRKHLPALKIITWHWRKVILTI